MYICEVIRQSNEIFCFTIRNRSITAHAFSHVNSSRSRQKIKQFQQILNFYAKVKKDRTHDKKATTQDKKDILGTKGTKQGHSGQKGRKGTFLALCFSLRARGGGTRTFLFLKCPFFPGLWPFCPVLCPF